MHLPMRLLQFAVITAFLVSAQNGYGQPGSRPETALPACLQKANHLLDEAFTFMQRNYYHKNSVNWDTLIAAAKNKLNGSGNCDETYDIISWCFKELNEPHSFIMPPAKAAIYNNDTASLEHKPSINELAGDIKGELLENGVAYLTVPWVSTTDSEICTIVADSLQQLISAMDTDATNGWIVDLRKNTGGNCWPM